MTRGYDAGVSKTVLQLYIHIIGIIYLQIFICYSPDLNSDDCT